MNGRRVAVLEKLPLRHADHVRDRLARVAAPALAEDQDEIGRGGDETAEVRSLAARRRRQGEGQQQCCEQAGGPEQDLRQDERRDALVGAARNRACRIQRDVRGQRRKHGEAPLGIGGDLLVRAELDRIDRAVRKPRAAGGREIVHQPPRLDQLAPLETRRRRHPGLVVVTVDGRSQAAVDERVGAGAQEAPCRRRICLGAGFGEYRLSHIALREGALAACDLDHDRAVARARRLADREADAECREDGEHGDHRDDRRAAARCERPERRRGASDHCTTNRACMPPR